MDNKIRSNFSEVGPAFLERPALGLEIIRTATLEAICGTQESFFLLWILV
jgi:hypothetical protein